MSIEDSEKLCSSSCCAVRVGGGGGGQGLCCVGRGMDSCSATGGNDVVAELLSSRCSYSRRWEVNLMARGPVA